MRSLPPTYQSQVIELKKSVISRDENFTKIIKSGKI